MEESLYLRQLKEDLLIKKLKQLIHEQPESWKWRSTIKQTIELLEGE